MKLLQLFVFSSYVLLGSLTALQAQSVAPDYLEIAEAMLLQVKKQQPTALYEEKLANADPNELHKQLNDDNKRKAFWINVYNAFVQISLQKNPAQFESRGKFFAGDQFVVANEKLSLDKIEHGIIRGSRSKLTLGLTKKLFVDQFEKKFRVKKRDGRIHFALNCGAKSCPPVAVYQANRIDEQLNKSTKLFLTQNSKFEAEANIVNTTVLFSWFRGDFGGFKGVKQHFLKQFNVIPENVNPKLKFTKYDWTLSLGNFIEL